MEHPNRISLTPTVARQTAKNDFGDVLKNALNTGVHLAGSLMGSIPGAGIISAAVSNVSAVANSGRGNSSAVASSGIVTVGGGGLATTTGGSTGGNLVGQMSGASGEVSPALNGYISEMRAEADRSMMMQMQMQQESREYNTLSNVLKVRHDSAKAAINNVR